ncbi:response regulator transcription factor [Paraburkholderia sp. SOS3]|jgi:FixJ family two-component response regulator|uniref:response regulator transcription factor n=1 Tax=Paraburkholderia sp. SOS3 TaxID=1926494 RepID=UPI0009472E20|nr:response regulator [Paraburkholderia sp. SOS3]APR34993.1 DNA-binding response regulator [Paraburkholderia sp. SOS3]
MSNRVEERSTDGADNAIVYVVDDDESVRESLRDLLRSAGFSVETFANAEDFLAFDKPDAVACVVLDVRLKGQSGLYAQERLNENHISLPVIFITAHGDIEMSVKALKRGAADFFTKPFRDQDLLDAVMAALDTDRKRREEVRSRDDLMRCYDSLTQRERNVTDLIVRGYRNKDIATQMSLSEATVKTHRNQAMKKMGSTSLAEFVLKVQAIDVDSKDIGPRALKLLR